MNQNYSQQNQYKIVELLDRNGFNQPVKALSISIPTHWQSSGGIFWDAMATYPSETIKTDWQAQGDGNYRIQLLSAEAWQASNMGSASPFAGSLNLPITTIRQYLEYYVVRYRSNAQIIGYSDRLDLSVKPEDLQDYCNRASAMTGQSVQKWIQGGEILIRYDECGYAFEEIIVSIAVFDKVSSGNTFFGVGSESLSGSSNFSLAMRAPVGKLNLRLTETIRQSILQDPNWQATVDQIRQQQEGTICDALNKSRRMGNEDFRNNIDAMNKRHKMQREANNSVQNTHRENFQNKQAARDKSHHKSVQTIREEATFYDPHRQEYVELPDTHNVVWRVSDGRNVRTNDYNFDPNRDWGMYGYRLIRQG